MPAAVEVDILVDPAGNTVSPYVVVLREVVVVRCEVDVVDLLVVDLNPIVVVHLVDLVVVDLGAAM